MLDHRYNYYTEIILAEINEEKEIGMRLKVLTFVKHLNNI